MAIVGNSYILKQYANCVKYVDNPSTPSRLFDDCHLQIST